MSAWPLGVTSTACCMTETASKMSGRLPVRSKRLAKSTPRLPNFRAAYIRSSYFSWGHHSSLPTADNSSLPCRCSSRGIPVTNNDNLSAGTPSAEVKLFVIPEILPFVIRVSDCLGNPRLYHHTYGPPILQTILLLSTSRKRSPCILLM